MNNLEKAQLEYENFIQQFQSVIISTANKQGIPNASYTPFVIDESKNIYIYVSSLSAHTQNLFNNPHVSVMFIEDEGRTEQIFARRRLFFDCNAILIERDTDTWLEIVAQFKNQFGEIIDILRDLADFSIFKLTPQQGRFVIGFGAAYSISGENFSQLQQIQK